MIRSAVCDRLAAIPNSGSSCYDDGYKHLLNVEKTPRVDPATLGTSVQLLWEALSLSEAVNGYPPWLILHGVFDYVVLPWMMPFAAGFIVWVSLIRTHLAGERRALIRRYATFLMMSCVAVPLMLLAPVKALDKIFERVEQNFPVSESRLTGPGYRGLILGGKELDEASAIHALRELAYNGGRTTRLIEFALYGVLVALCLRMTFLLTRVMGRTSLEIIVPLLGIFVIVMSQVL
jgi:hypothetical protein